MNSRPTARCSALPDLMLCSNSVLNPDDLLPIEHHFDATGLGTAVHALIHCYVQTSKFDLGSLSGRFDKPDLERGAFLMQQAMRVWDQVKNTPGNLQCEIEVTGETAELNLIGHADVLWMPAKHARTGYDGTTAHGLDYKTGRVHNNHYHQLAGYAYCVWCTLGNPKDFTIHFSSIYLEDMDVSNFTFTTERLEEWAAGVDVQVKARGYTINHNCVNCRFQASCPAYRETLKTALTVFGAEVDDIRKADDATRAEVFLKLKSCDKQHGYLRALIKADVTKHGPLPTGDGREFFIAEREEKSLDLALALPILFKHMEEADVLACLRASLTDITDIVTNKARGSGAEAREKLMAALAKAGAVRRVTTQRLETRKIKDQTP